MEQVADVRPEVLKVDAQLERRNNEKKKMKTDLEKVKDEPLRMKQDGLRQDDGILIGAVLCPIVVSKVEGQSSLGREETPRIDNAVMYRSKGERALRIVSLMPKFKEKERVEQVEGKGQVHGDKYVVWTRQRIVGAGPILVLNGKDIRGCATKQENPYQIDHELKNGKHKVGFQNLLVKVACTGQRCEAFKGGTISDLFLETWKPF